jgi:Xaa-Pro aminopeptidase
MFQKEIYIQRRAKLKSLIANGIALFLGNIEEPYNYRANTYKFRQDSDFSYFFGLNDPDLAAIIDFESGQEIIFGNNIGMEDIIWMGNLPSVSDRSAKVGVSVTEPVENLASFVSNAINKGRKVHFLAPYRASNKQWLHQLLKLPVEELKKDYSIDLTKSVVALRSVKGAEEIKEIEGMIDVAYTMHTTAMKMAKPGVHEKEIAGVLEGIAASHGNGISFPVILSMNGEILHNHSHHQVLEKGRLMVVDAGSESDLLYSSDITRTFPVGGKFDSRQKEIYQLVLAANQNTIAKASPDKYYKEMHLEAAHIIASGFKELGLMKGNTDDAVSQGAHALFFSHGLGHAMGLDVHDMEGLGEDYVGYDQTVSRSDQFGLAYLRFAKKPKPGTVLTVEPGVYFNPILIDLWKSEKKFTGYINYDKLESYKNFGGIRIEDDILITEKGCRLLGKPIPKTVEEIEETMR